MRKKYATEEERKTAHKEAQKKWYQANKERIAEQYKANKDRKLEYQAEYRKANTEKIAEYYKINKEKIAEYNAEYYAEYHSTPIGRATHLLSDYKRKDKKYNRGDCTLTSQWIVDNIFSKPCHYCGESDWHKIGCDRIDNSKAHTEDNVVPCCSECNTKRGTMEYNKFIELNTR